MNADGGAEKYILRLAWGAQMPLAPSMVVIPFGTVLRLGALICNDTVHLNGSLCRIGTHVQASGEYIVDVRGWPWPFYVLPSNLLP